MYLYFHYNLDITNGVDYNWNISTIIDDKSVKNEFCCGFFMTYVSELVFKVANCI